MRDDAAAPCAASVTLAHWLRELAAEGFSERIDEQGVTLVKIDAPPSQAPEALRVVVASNRTGPDELPLLGSAADRGHPLFEVTFRGQLVGAGSDPSAVARDLELQLAEPNVAKLAVSFLIDGSVPWAWVSKLANAASAAGHAKLVFGFSAGGKSRVAAPGASSIDDLLAAQDRVVAEASARGELLPLRPNGLADAIYKDCPTARALLSTGPSDDRQSPADRLLAELPKAIAACDCRVELAAVERTMWRLWGRDTLTAWISVELAAGGTKITAPAGAPWSDASRLVVGPASRGPIDFE